MKIGIFGGSFNPVHIGHIRVAIDVLRLCKLDEVWFNCTSFSPHKKDVVPFFHRYNMLKIALKNYESLFPCDVDIKNKFLYTIDTMKFLESKYKNIHEFYFLIGLDAFLEIRTWKDWRELFEITNFIVFNRSGIQSSFIGVLKHFLNLNVVPGGSNDVFIYKGKIINQVKIKSLNISGSEIRDMIKKNVNITTCVGKEVANYIEANNLYR